MASAPSSASRLQAVAFDAFGTLFDVYSVGLLAEQLYPGKGQALADLWRQKQLEYSFLRTLAGRYKPFWDITRDALHIAAAQLGLALDSHRATQLMNQYACLSPFPENRGVLRALKERRIPTAILSNGTTEMLTVALKSAGLSDLFDHVLSVDAVRKYKPAPEAYALGPQAFACAPERILFVSANGWDASGGAAFGYTSLWINRFGDPAEMLDPAPGASARSLSEVLAFFEAKP